MSSGIIGWKTDLIRCINNGEFSQVMLVNIGIAATNEDIVNQGTKMNANDKKYLRELRGALPPVVFNYIRSCKTTKDIWDTLK